jgi:hypothetical protein
VRTRKPTASHLNHRVSLHRFCFPFFPESATEPDRGARTVTHSSIHSVVPPSASLSSSLVSGVLQLQVPAEAWSPPATLLPFPSASRLQSLDAVDDGLPFGSHSCVAGGYCFPFYGSTATTTLPFHGPRRRRLLLPLLRIRGDNHAGVSRPQGSIFRGSSSACFSSV